MRIGDYTAALCVLISMHTCTSQPQLAISRERILDPPNIINIRDMVRLHLAAANPLSQRIQSCVVSEAVGSVVSSLERTIASQEMVNVQAFNAGIDRVSVAATDASGPHLLTRDAAVDIGRSGMAFLETAARIARRLNIETNQIGASFKQAGIMPDIHPDIRFPPRLQCPFAKANWPLCNLTEKYRSIDGSCNNIHNPLWGKAFTPFERFIPASYGDGFSSPRSVSFADGVLPPPRTISTQFHLPLSVRMPDLSHLAMEYGQFISHDIQFNALSTGSGGSNLDCCASRNRPACFPIDITPNDPFFPLNRTCMNMVRSIPTPNLDCTLGVREQLNQNTHYHDGSQVYGSDKETADSLRDMSGGTLKASGGLLLPTKTGSNAGCIITNQNRPCFHAGDVRANQQPGLLSLHTMWAREHNRIAAGLKQLNPSWSDEKLYQEARRIVIAMMQHITYNEYLPAILGNAAMIDYGLHALSSGYFTGYDTSVKGIIRNGFSTAAFRFGHSMIYHKLPTHNGNTVTTDNHLKDLFLKPDLVYTRGVGEITRGLTRSPSEKVDRYITPQVTRHLFERQPGFGGDLASININRGRDHGLPNYLLYRKYCNLQGHYSHDPQVIQDLQNVYVDPQDMDLFTAGVSERPVPGGKVGPTFACLIGQQFQALKKGDRFFYENSGQNGFTPDQLQQIRRISMSKIICRNTDIQTIQRNAFKQNQPGNPLVGCQFIKDIDLTSWGEISGGCVPVYGDYSTWQRTPCYDNFRIRYRRCNDLYPNECGTSCPQPFEIEVESCGLSWPRSLSTFLSGRGVSMVSPRMAAPAAPATPAFTSSDISSQIQAALAGQTHVDSSALVKALSAVTSRASSV